MYSVGHPGCQNGNPGLEDVGRNEPQNKPNKTDCTVASRNEDRWLLERRRRRDKPAK
jgi:hypothetical protein